VIDSVRTADGFTEIRQGGHAELVLTGRHLGDVTSVTLGTVAATIVSATDGELRADVDIPHAHGAGPLPVLATSPGGAAIRPDAIAITYFIVSPAGTADGRGTFQSPLSMCAADTDATARGDTLQFLAGEHRCAETVFLPEAGVHVVGAGVGQTVLVDSGGFEILNGDRDDVTSLSGMTARRPTTPVLTANAYGFDGIRVADLSIEGAQRDGIFADDLTTSPPSEPYGRSVSIDRFEYEGSATGLYLWAARGTVSNTRIRSAGATGVRIAYGDVTVTGLAITGASVGIAAGDTRAELTPQLRVLDSVLRDCRQGVTIVSGGVTLERTEISDDPTTPAACEIGAFIEDGGLTVRGGRIACTRIGISAEPVDGDFSTDASAGILIEGATVEGGESGIAIGSSEDTSDLVIRGSHIHGGTVAAVRYVDGDDTRCDFTSTGASGGNDFSTTSGVAIRDQRRETFPTWQEIPAAGTTLNGRSYAGQRIEGPASHLPDYEVRGDGILQF